MNTATIITSVWDHGWLCRDTVELAPASSAPALIEHYVVSRAFHTSFLPSDKDETGIHGPFLAERIHANDYVPLQQWELDGYLESIKMSESPGDDVAERAKLLPHLREAFDGRRKCYVLKWDERNKELFHDWGFVLWVFREFLFVGAQCDSLERFVIGFD